MKRLDVLRDLRYVSSNFVSGKLRESQKRYVNFYENSNLQCSGVPNFYSSEALR